MTLQHILQQFHNQTTTLFSSPESKGREGVNIELEIAGLKYNELDAIYHHLHSGTALRLVREYNNPYDEKAVAIYYQNFKLGYIPKVYNISVSRMLDRGFVLETAIKGIQKQKYLPAESILISITDQLNA